MHRHLPHLPAFDAAPIVYLTVCTHRRKTVLGNPQAHAVLREIWAQSDKRNGWFVGRYVIMPDHVHLFARPAREADALRDWVKMWKSLSARTLATSVAVKPPVWQADYFDRYLRSADNYSMKWDYVWQNPEVARLAPSPEAWPYQGEIHRLRY